MRAVSCKREREGETAPLWPQKFLQRIAGRGSGAVSQAAAMSPRLEGAAKWGS